MMSDILNKEYWESRWQTGQTGWDLRQPSPPLEQFAVSLPEKYRALPLLIPGCGNGHEAIFLAENGFSNITMLDIAPAAIENLQKSLDVLPTSESAKINLVCQDFFEHHGQYALILEQTFFCALNPIWREQYAKKMQSLLVPDGILAGVLFDCHFEGGPPFGGTKLEYQKLFGSFFEIVKMETCYNSIAPRAGKEVFFHLRNSSFGASL